MMFFHKDGQLEEAGDRILEAFWAAFPGVARNQLALTWVVYDPPVRVNTGGAISPEEFWKYSPRGFSYRGVECMEPAGLAHLFYLVAIQEWLERGMVQPSAELDRALRNMTVNSSNDAASLVVDILTGTTSGPELPPQPFETWKQQRQIVNRYLKTFDWQELNTVNICQKTWTDGPYGRERAFLGEMLENRNQLTTIAMARLLHSIVGGVSVSAARSQTMLHLLQRSPAVAETVQPDASGKGFLGAGLPADAHLWSKATVTSQVRHQAAYIELMDARPYLLVVFLEGKFASGNEAILPFLSQQVVQAVRSLE